MLVLLVVFASSIRADAATGRGLLYDRFSTRAELTGRFVTEFVSDLAARESSAGSRSLISAPDQGTAMDEVVRSFGFDVAVLVDDEVHRVGTPIPAAVR